MAYIEKRIGKKGTSYVVRFTREGRACKVSLSSDYTIEDAEAAVVAVDGFIRAERLGEPLDRKTRLYFDNAPRDLIKRFSALGFTEAKKNLSIAEVWERFLRFSEKQVKPATITHRVTVFNRLTSFFSEGVKLCELTPEDLMEFRDEMSSIYAPTTVSKTVADLRTFGSWAVERGYVDANPFTSIPRGATNNRARDFQVPAEWTDKILECCPTQSWRTLYCLWRHAGLRQQEPLGLTIKSVDLRNRRLFVHSTKTERYGENHGDRVVPIVPTLYRELERQLSELPRDAEYLIYENRRKGFDSAFRRIQFDAGLPRWPKTFQNLRSSCENDWVQQGIPAHVVASWIGHSVKVQEAYYLRVLPEYFERVTA